MRRYTFLPALTFITVILSSCFAQNTIVPLNTELLYNIEPELYKKQDNFHSGIKPYLTKNSSAFTTDSLHVFGTGFNLINPNPIHNENSKFKLSVNPLLNGELLSEANEKARFRYGVGMGVNFNVKDKLGLSGFYRYANEPRMPFQDSSVFMGDIVNGLGMQAGNDLNAAHHAEFYLTYSPNNYFSFMAGHGKHFWGEGYRSFMLSDNASPYPFFRITSTFWKIQYTNLYSMHKDDTYGARQNKFSASHQLSWNILPNLNLTIFESVVWQGRDTLNNRNFDINYVNPVIFYRPVEFAKGSSDNVFLGMSMSGTIEEKYVLYGQLVLDEFLLAEIRARNGWWANKYGIQLGFKTYDLFGVQNLSFQSEYNFARPFTYTHVTSLQNYGHNDQSLAHPLGANFNESVNRIRYKKNNWYFEAKVLYIDRGEDTSSVSQGGNIFLSYSDRDGEYGHSTGQGQGHYIWYNELKISYNLVKKMNLRAFASYALRTDKYNHQTDNQHLFQVGLTTNIWNTYSDY